MHYGFMHNRGLVDGLFQAVNFKMEQICRIGYIAVQHRTLSQPVKPLN